MEKSYSVSYLLILSHLQKMLGEDGDYLLAQLISWGRAAIRGYRWQGTEWIAMSVRKHKTFWCLSDITMGASLPWRTGNIGWYLKDFVFCFSKKRIISRWKICGGAKSCIFVRYFIAALIWECHIVKKKKQLKKCNGIHTKNSYNVSHFVHFYIFTIFAGSLDSDIMDI